MRNIDDLLLGEHNSTAGTVSSHRPTDVDGLVGQLRAVTLAKLLRKLRWWKSDFSKAYKQVPAPPNQMQWVVIVQWDPTTGDAAFFLTLSQVFGSRTHL